MVVRSSKSRRRLDNSPNPLAPFLCLGVLEVWSLGSQEIEEKVRCLLKYEVGVSAEVWSNVVPDGNFEVVVVPIFQIVC